jgi:HD-like signal output (HDOD) protein
LAAEQLARLRHPQLVSEAFIAALLHDLGATIQVHVDAEGFRRMVDALRAAPSQDLRTLESSCVSISQERCAAVLFEHWQLPVSLSACARAHHHPREAPEPQRILVALVHVGNGASLLAPAAIDSSALADVGVVEEDLARIARDLPERMAAFFGPIG